MWFENHPDTVLQGVILLGLGLGSLVSVWWECRAGYRAVEGHFPHPGLWLVLLVGRITLGCALVLSGLPQQLIPERVEAWAWVAVIGFVAVVGGTFFIGDVVILMYDLLARR
jgi:hypothetical protein